MFIQKIFYQVEGGGEILAGYYVRKYKKYGESIVLDEKYKPVDVLLWNLWDNVIPISIKEKEDIFISMKRSLI